MSQKKRVRQFSHSDIWWVFLDTKYGCYLCVAANSKFTLPSVFFPKPNPNQISMILNWETEWLAGKYTHHLVLIRPDRFFYRAYIILDTIKM